VKKKRGTASGKKKVGILYTEGAAPRKCKKGERPSERNVFYRIGKEIGIRRKERPEQME